MGDGVFGDLSIQSDDLKYDLNLSTSAYQNKTNHYDSEGYSVPKIITLKVDGDASTFTMNQMELYLLLMKATAG